MQKNLILLAAISIVLILAAVLSGIYFTSTPAQPTSAWSDPLTVDPMADLHSFGDDDKYAVLLNLAEAQVRPETTLILTAAASKPSVPDETICTHTGVSVTTLPAGVPQHSIGQDRQDPTIWHQVRNWFAAPFQDHYAVTLWVPGTPHNSFTLVSGDAPASPVVCSHQVDEDV